MTARKQYTRDDYALSAADNLFAQQDDSHLHQWDRITATPMEEVYKQHAGLC